MLDLLRWLGKGDTDLLREWIARPPGDYPVCLLTFKRHSVGLTLIMFISGEENCEMTHILDVVDMGVDLLDLSCCSAQQDSRFRVFPPIRVPVADQPTTVV